MISKAFASQIKRNLDESRIFAVLKSEFTQLWKAPV